MKSATTAILALLVTTVLTGCTGKVNEETETDMGTHHVVVKHGSSTYSSSSSTGGGTETYQFSCGKISITIQDEELIVNDVSYGQLKTGEDVLVDNGKVFVAGQERKGTP